VIHNGIDHARFRPRSVAPVGPPTIGMAGHLTPWKGHERFVRTARAIRDRVSDATFSIAGGHLYDTSDHQLYPEQLRALIQDLGLADVVDIDHLTQEEMPDWYRSLTVFVHCPDRPEPFGRALVEALASGVPIVVAAGDAAAEVVGSAAVVVPLGDEKRLLQEIVAVLGDEPRRTLMAERGLARARAQFDVGRYARRTADVIRAAAQPRADNRS
jgi:glycosyltransferase involved in cell wall biosynthesis